MASCLESFFDCAPNSPTLSGFCCPAGTQCQWLAANTTLLCCPEDMSCERISAFPCDLDKYDPESSRDAPIKTVALDVDMPRCGDGCCPHGFVCNNGEQCTKLSIQDVAPGEEADNESNGEDADDDGLATTTTSTTQSPAMSTDPSNQEPTVTLIMDSETPPSDALRIGVPVGLTLFFLLVLSILGFIVWRRRTRSSAWRHGSWRGSQQRFDKAELDAGSECEISASAKRWEVEVARAPVELAATPLPMYGFRS